MIIGVDEVGRGSWAGPLCVAAVAWPDDAPVKGLNDSKKLTAAKRREMAVHIRNYAAGIGIGWVPAGEIDRIGLTAALKIGARAAVMQIGQIAPIIMDGRDKILGDIKADYVIKADGKIPAVMAASIIAKVARDAYMAAIDAQFAGYNFAKHVGYGTSEHQRAIIKLGPCEHHRLSWEPLKIYAA
jgi:ribonuclease HII